MASFVSPFLTDWYQQRRPAAPTGGNPLFPTTPNPGKGAFGEVPAGVNLPPALTSGIQRDLSGEVSPEIAQRLQQIAATFGIQSGMPMGGLAANRYAHDYLGASDVARQRGTENWMRLLPLQQQNAELAAAPNPTQRALTEQSFAQQMFDRYLQALRGSGGGQQGGGYRSPAAGTVAPTTGTATGGIPSPPAIHGEGEEGYNYSVPSTQMGDVSYVGGMGSPADWGAPAGTSYDPYAMTYNAPDALDLYSSYWDDLFAAPTE